MVNLRPKKKKSWSKKKNESKQILHVLYGVREIWSPKLKSLFLLDLYELKAWMKFCDENKRVKKVKIIKREIWAQNKINWQRRDLVEAV